MEGGSASRVNVIMMAKQARWIQTTESGQLTTGGKHIRNRNDTEYRRPNPEDYKWGLSSQTLSKQVMWHWNKQIIIFSPPV